MGDPKFQFENPSEKETDETELLVITLENSFHGTPLAYKHFFVRDDMAMVLGGLKAAVDLNFLEDTYNDNDWERLKTVLEEAGLRTSQLMTRKLPNGATMRSVEVYSPRTLAKETKNSKLVLSYHPEETLEAWMRRCEEAGIARAAIEGKIFSFPEASIKGYIEGKQALRSLRTHGETYKVYGDDSDTDAREERKHKFFERLTLNSAYQAIAQSADLEASREEWSKRLPEALRRA